MCRLPPGERVVAPDCDTCSPPSPFDSFHWSPLEPASTPRQHATCPQDLAPVAASSLPPEKTLGTPLSQAVFDTSAEPGILKALPLKEVLRRIGKHADLQALYERRGESDSGPDGNRRCSVVLRQTTKILDLRGFSYTEAL